MADLEGPFLSDDLNLTLTGERTLPGIPAENYWFRRHVAAYRYAAGLVAGKVVLDAGCGEGYGADLLAGAASGVVGVDLDEGVVAHAGRTYARPRFQKADLQALPFPDASFDAVVTFQVIEHVPGPRDFIGECRRVLRPGGVLILSTPNRFTFSRDGIRNPFHTYEFAPEELRTLVASHLTVERAAGTFHGARLRVVETLTRESFPERLIRQPAPEWPRWLKGLVARVTERDFAIRDSGLERSLDLVIVARR